jgi:peroxiredoxin
MKIKKILNHGLSLIFFLMISIEIFAQSALPKSANDISPLLIGESVATGNLVNSDGDTVAVGKIISNKPTVIIVYRGGWCPYCNVQMAELQEIEKDILELGFQIIGVSPDSEEYLKESIDKHKLNYTLYSDADLTIIKSWGLAFEAPERNKQMLVLRSQNLNPGILPVPAVFVVNTQGIIQFEYVNPKYDTRMDGEMLKAVLKTIK